jgi:hypothetical protein
MFEGGFDPPGIPEPVGIVPCAAKGDGSRVMKAMAVSGRLRLDSQDTAGDRGVSEQ